MSLRDKQETNEKKLEKIKFEILRMEDENSKTKYYSNSDIVEKIKQIIKNGVDGKLV